jgi:putative tricarboxylic transport membrane protein
MRRYQISSAGFLLLLGAFFCFEARTLAIGRIVQPGPGFFPFWLGLALVILSLALIGKGFHERIEAASVSQGLWKGLRWEKVIFSLGALLLYAFFLESLGYILSTFLLMFFLFRTIEAQRWPVVILGSVITSFVTYILFRLWLQVQLPMGLWGI